MLNLGTGMNKNQSNSSCDNADVSLGSLRMSIVERKLKFYSLITLLIPSVLLTVFIFYHFRWRHLQSQIYAFVLMANFLIVAVELPITLYFLHEGTIHSTSRCAGWITLNYSLFQLSIFLMAWTSIERYLFIYHEQFIVRHVLLLHYGPICILYLYCSLLYVGLVVLNTCKPMYNIELYICGGPCYSLDLTLGLFDWIGNGIAMESLILIVNVVIIIRHFVRRQRMKKMIVTAAKRQQLGRSVKLAVQLLSIAVPYVIAWFPYSIIVLIQMFRNSKQLAHILSTFLVYLPYLQSLLLPYVCILFIPNIKRKFFALWVYSSPHRHDRRPNRMQETNER